MIRGLAATVALAALAGCTGGSSGADPASPRQEEFAALRTAIERIHPEPLDSSWHAAADTTRARLDSLTANEYLAAVARTAMLGDLKGHGGVFPTDQPDLQAWPLRLYEFPDGWRILAAHDRTLIGSRLDGIGGHPVDDVVEALSPVVPRDNPHSLRARLAIYLVWPAMLDGVGMLGDGRLSVTGERGTRTLPALQTVNRDAFVALTGIDVPQIPLALPLHTPPPDPYFWSSRRQGALVVGYERVLRESPTGLLVDDFLATLRADVTRQRPRVVVVDVRRNPGGENASAQPLIDWLRELTGARIPVRVLVGRGSYSATGVAFAPLEDVALYGEPSGGGSGTFGDPRPHTLAASGIRVQVPSRWSSGLDRDVPALVPDVSVPTTWAGYAAGRDEVLEAALR